MGCTDIIHGDRRSDRRYEYEMELQFSYRKDGTVHYGSGKTVDMSRIAVRFLADGPPPDGADLEMRISWPFLLQNVCPLELLVHGTVTRTTARGTILAMKHCEFRTCGQRSFGQAAYADSSSSFLA